MLSNANICLTAVFVLLLVLILTLGISVWDMVDKVTVLESRASSLENNCLIIEGVQEDDEQI